MALDTSMYSNIQVPKIAGLMDLEERKQNLVSMKQQGQLQANQLEAQAQAMAQQKQQQARTASMLGEIQAAGEDPDKQVGIRLKYGDIEGAKKISDMQSAEMEKKAKFQDAITKFDEHTQKMAQQGYTDLGNYAQTALNEIGIDPSSAANIWHDSVERMMEKFSPVAGESQQARAVKLNILNGLAKEQAWLNDPNLTPEALESRLRMHVSHAKTHAEWQAEALEAMKQEGKQAGLDLQERRLEAQERHWLAMANRPTNISLTARYTAPDAIENLSKLDQIAAVRMAESGQRETPSVRNPGALARNALADILQADPERLVAMKETHHLTQGTNAAIVKAAVAGDAKALSSMTQQYHALQALESTASKNAEELKSVYKGMVDTGSPFLNKPIRALAAGAGGEQGKRAAALLEGLKAEYTRINSGNVINAVHKDIQEHMDAILSGDMTVGQLVAALDTLKKEGHNRTSSIKEQINSIKGGGQRPRSQASQSSGKSISVDDAMKELERLK